MKNLQKRRSVEVSNLGQFNNTGMFEVQYKEEVVCLLDMDFLHHGLPTLELKAVWQPKPPFFFSTEDLNESPSDILLGLLSSPNIASKERWVRQYDHEVLGQSVVKPFEGVENDGPCDASVIKP